MRILHARWWLALAVTGFAAVAFGAGPGHVARTFPARGLTAVTVDVAFPDVTVTAGAGSAVRVTVDLEAAGSSKKAAKVVGRYETGMAVEDGVLGIHLKRRHRRWWGHDRIRGTVRLAVPAGLNVTVRTDSGSCTFRGDFGRASIDVRTDSGRVAFVGAAGRLAVNSATGGVALTLEGAPESVTAVTASAGIEIRGPAGRLTVQSSSGAVVGSGLSGPTTVTTGSGAVRLSWRSLGGATPVKVTTDSGDVDLVFPAGSRLAGTVKTAAGGVRTDFPGNFTDRGRTFLLTAEDPAASIDVATGSGSVTIAAAEPGPRG